MSRDRSRWRIHVTRMTGMMTNYKRKSCFCPYFYLYEVGKAGEASH